MLPFAWWIRGEASLWRICLLTTHGSKLPSALLATCEPLFAHGAYLLILIFTAVCEGVRLDPPNKKGAPFGAPFCLVDPRGIEPLSENLFTGPSPWAVCDLKFPSAVGHRRSTPSGSPFLHDRYKCELSVHVHHCMTPHPRSWSSSAERVALCHGTALRQPVRLDCQRLILK